MQTTFTIFQKRLRLLSNELEAYFQKMFEKIEASYQEKTAQTLLKARQPLSVVAISFYDLERMNADYVLDNPIPVLAEEDVEISYKTVRKRLYARCQDLLVISVVSAHQGFQYNIEFLHRTLRDFLVTQDMQTMLDSWTAKSFDPAASLRKALLGQIESLSKEACYRLGDGFLTESLHGFMFYASEAEGWKSENEVFITRRI